MKRSPREAAIEYAACLRDGDFQRLVYLHDENLVCALLGNSRVSGRYRGRDAFFAHTFKYVLGALAETDEIYLKGYRIACADSCYAALLLHGGLPTRHGGRYDQNYLQIFRVEDGLIREIHELLDTVMLETQVLGKVLAQPRGAVTEPLTPASKFSGPDWPVDVAADAAAADRVERHFSDTIDSLDMEACLALLHPDAVLQIAGSTPSSGVVRGRPAISERLAAYAAAHFVPRSWRIDGPTRLICKDAGGFCRLANVLATLKTGQEYRQIVGIVGRIAGDSIVEVHLYFDTAVEEMYVFGNPLSGGSDETGPEPFGIEADGGAA